MSSKQAAAAGSLSGKRSASAMEEGAVAAAKPRDTAGKVSGRRAGRLVAKGGAAKAASSSTKVDEDMPIGARGFANKASKEELLAHVDDLSSDDEAPKNTIGNVPLEWYNEYDHIGYDVTGKRIGRKASAAGDRIDAFLRSQDDPLYRWTIYDAENDEEVTLSKRDVAMLRNLQSGTYAHPEFDPTAPQYNLTDLYSSTVEVHPLSSGTEPKRRFLPSKWEMRKVMRIAKAIKEGRYRRESAKPASARPLYLLWEADTDAVPGWDGAAKRGPLAIAAPKMPPPGHATSYNPPPEYLPTEEERAAWEAMDPKDRPTAFLPTRYACLRHVPLYKPGVRERFERCLDLYLCPRSVKERLNVDPASLLPKLPDPAELRPFPTAVALEFLGHASRVRSIAVDPSGAWLVSGGDDKTVRLWDTATGRCVRAWSLPEVPQQVAWCPDASVALVAVAAGTAVLLLYPGTATAWNAQATFDALRGHRAGEAAAPGSAGAVKAADDDSDGDDDDGGSDSDGDGEGAGAGDAASRATRKLKQVQRKAADSKAAGSSSSSAGVAAAAADGKKGSGRRVVAVDEAGDVGEAAAASDSEGGDSDSDAEGGQGRGKGRAGAGAAAADGSVAVRTARWVVAEEHFPTAPAGLLSRPGAPSAAAAAGVLLTIEHSNQVKRLAWHGRGDYLVAVSPGAASGAVMIHQVSRRASNCPFGKHKGLVQTAAFHPIKPILFVANQHAVRSYNLQSGEMESKLEAGVRWISSLEVHPSGEHVVVGSFDQRTVWFDVGLSAKPFKTLRYHAKGVRRAAFHRTAPLMATASDDGTLHVFHARVNAEELGSDPLIVPVKILRGGHAATDDGLGVLDAVFHPSQPWLFSAGSDGSIKLWHNLP